MTKTLTPKMKEAKPLVLKYYGIQEDIINDFINTDKHLMNVLAVASGKSIVNQFLALIEALNNPGSNILIIAPTIEMVRDVYFENPDWNIKDYVKQHYVSKGQATINLNQKTITFTNGSRIALKTMSDYKKLRGLTATLVILDELAIQNDAENVVSEIFSRIRPKIGDKSGKWGRIVITSSPHGRNSFYDLYKKHSKDPDWIVRRKNGYECKTQTKEYYDKLKTKPSYEADVMVQFVAVEGRVLSAFDENKHVQKVTIDEDAPIYHAVDYNIGKMASIQFQVKENKLVAVDNFYMRNKGTRDFFKALSTKYKGHKGGHILVPDASFSHRSTAADANVTNKTISLDTKNPLTGATFFSRSLVRKNNTDSDGATQINDLFLRNLIIIGDNCTDVIGAFNTLRWNPESNYTKTEDDLEYDCYFDVTKYICNRLMRHLENSGQKINIH